MEDVIETLLGIEIVDESDRTVDMQVFCPAQLEAGRVDGLDCGIDPRGKRRPK